MSNIDIYAVLEKFRRYWDHWDHVDRAVQVIDSIVEHLRAAEQTGYLGTLYRTDFEVEGKGAFPIDMLRYTYAWPKGENDARAIEDSFDSSVRHTVALCGRADAEEEGYRHRRTRDGRGGWRASARAGWPQKPAGRALT